MAVQHDPSGGCIGGEGNVKVWGVENLRQGDFVYSKKVKHLRQGDFVETPSGWEKIECVMVSNATDMVLLSDRLLITPWHPVRVIGNTEWTFPSQWPEKTTSEREAAYSILLVNRGVSLIVNETFECICLAHGIIDDPVARHGYYGTEAVVESMRMMQGWNVGIVDARAPLSI